MTLLGLAPSAMSQPFVDVTPTALTSAPSLPGIAWADYDGDGDADLYLTTSGSNSLYRNDGSDFVDATFGVEGDPGNGVGAAWGDYDNDGDPDLYVVNNGTANKLFRNDDGAFVDAAAGPAADSGGGIAAAWTDYDLDGDVDIYLANNGANKLFENDGGVFTDVTAAPLDDGGFGRSAIWGDYDRDGDADVYIANLNSTNELLRNDGGSFVDVTSGPLGISAQSYGAAWVDYDNDHDLDLYVVTPGAPNELLRNDGGSFSDVNGGALEDTGTGRGVTWGDYDNDGDLDAYLANATPLESKLIRNDAGTFADATAAPLTNLAASEGATWIDYDGDGDLDLFVGNASASKLFRNDAADADHWVGLDLTGKISNASAVGARVRVVAGGLSRVRDVSGGGGYRAQAPFSLRVGLGTAAVIDSLFVSWPSGIVQLVEPPAVDQTVQVKESEFVDVATGAISDSGPGQGVAWGDYDNDGDLDLYLANQDAANKLFQNDNGTFVDVTPGPLGDVSDGEGVAWGDYDNDGDLDLYLANALSANKLFRNDAGTFVDATTGPLADSQSGRSVAWVDYDGDGDLDLYLANNLAPNKLFRNDNGIFVASGLLEDTGPGFSVAWADYDNDRDPDLYVGNNAGANKLFRNDGGTAFVDVSTPPINDAGLAYGIGWADFDNDGDLDLYLANGSGASDNKLFRNDGNGFVDVASTLLADADFGQDIAWGDHDNDGDVDLYLVNLAGANKLFRNDGGTFVDATSGALGDSGLGQCAAWGDYDGDGDLDLYASSFGEPNQLLRNDSPQGNHWLHVDLTGTDSNTSAIGARVRIWAGGTAQIREVSGGSGYLSQGSLAVEFGLGSVTTVDSLRVLWPSGGEQLLTSIAADQVVPVVETPCVPQDPVLLALDEPEDSGGAIRLDWTSYSPPAGTVRFEVLRSTACQDLRQQGTVPIDTVVFGAAQQYLDTTAADYVEYFYGVRVVVDTQKIETTAAVLVAEPTSAEPNVVINEFTPVGLNLSPKRSRVLTELVEIRYLGPGAFDLTGYRLSNGPGPPFPDEEILSGMTDINGLLVDTLTTITLPDEGGVIELLAPGATTPVDRVRYGSAGGAPTAPEDFSVGRALETDPEEDPVSVFGVSAGGTMGGPNCDALTPDRTSSLAFNEVLHTVGPPTQYVELINPRSFTVSLDKIAVFDGQETETVVTMPLVLAPGETILLNTLPAIQGQVLYLNKVLDDGCGETARYQEIDRIGWGGAGAPDPGQLMVPNDALLRIPDGGAAVYNQADDDSATWFGSGGGNVLLYGARSPGAPNEAPGTTQETLVTNVTELAVALATSSPGDKVKLAPGTYDGQFALPEGVTLEGQGASAKDVVLTSSAEGTILSANGLSSGTISRLTIRGGQPKAPSGRGLEVLGSDIRVDLVRFEENCATGVGGAVTVSSGNPVFEDCLFFKNVSANDGAAVHVVSGAPTFERCLFVRNLAEGSGAAICAVGGITSIAESVFDRNSSYRRGTSGFTGSVIHSAGGDINVEYSIVNNTLRGAPLWVDGQGQLSTMTFSCGALYGYTTWFEPVAGVLETSNVVLQDPQFCQPLALNYAYASTSPVLGLDSGHCPIANTRVGVNGPPCGAKITVVEDSEAPARSQLYLPHPNPFNPRTVLRFDLAAPGSVSLIVYDVRGRRIAEPLDRVSLQAGTHETTWRGTDLRGRRVGSGVYFVRLQVDERVIGPAQRMLLLR